MHVKILLTGKLESLRRWRCFIGKEAVPLLQTVLMKHEITDAYSILQSWNPEQPAQHMKEILVT